MRVTLSSAINFILEHLIFSNRFFIAEFYFEVNSQTNRINLVCWGETMNTVVQTRETDKNYYKYLNKTGTNFYLKRTAIYGSRVFLIKLALYCQSIFRHTLYIRCFVWLP